MKQNRQIFVVVLSALFGISTGFADGAPTSYATRAIFYPGEGAYPTNVVVLIQGQPSAASTLLSPITAAVQYCYNSDNPRAIPDANGLGDYVVKHCSSGGGIPSVYLTKYNRFVFMTAGVSPSNKYGDQLVDASCTQYMLDLGSIDSLYALALGSEYRGSELPQMFSNRKVLKKAVESTIQLPDTLGTVLID